MGTEETTSDLWERFKERDQKLALHRKTTTKEHYEELKEAKAKDIPIAYITGITPPEICHTMGVLPALPENYVTICAARQMAEKFCEAAEARGMSRDLCAYTRCGLGMMWLEDGPYGALPKPDFVMANPLTCDPHMHWFALEARHFQVPLLLLDGPYRFKLEVEKHELEWMIGQIKSLFSSIEQITGKRFDYDRFKEIMKLSSQARELYQEIQEYRRGIPCPRGLREIVGDLFYIVTLFGTSEAVEYFTMVRDDVKERVEHGVGVLPQEKFRLIWDNIPLWYRLQLIDYFSDHGAVFAMDTYPTTLWTGFYFDGGHIDPEEPFEALALMHLRQYVWASLALQMKAFQRMVKEWHCDGAVFFSNRGCQILSGAVGEKERLFREMTGALSMSFEAEMADPRSLHEAQVKARIESFLEMLEQKKSQGE